MNKIEEVKKEFDKQFPEFKGVGAKYPMFENNPVRTHIWQFIERSVHQAVEEKDKEIKRLKDVLDIAYSAVEEQKEKDAEIVRSRIIGAETNSVWEWDDDRALENMAKEILKQ